MMAPQTPLPTSPTPSASSITPTFRGFRTNKAVTEALDGLPAHKLHCSVLAEEAIRTAVKDLQDKFFLSADLVLPQRRHIAKIIHNFRDGFQNCVYIALSVLLAYG